MEEKKDKCKSKKLEIFIYFIFLNKKGMVMMMIFFFLGSFAVFVCFLMRQK